MTGHTSSLGRAIKVSKQVQANQHMAHMLRDVYPGEDYAGILSILNQKTLKEYYNDR